jgi:ParB family transcriptional regulator, chromosome partitioning protein
MKINDAKLRKPPETLDKKDIGGASRGTVNVFNEGRKGEYYLLGAEQLIPFRHQARIFFDEEKINELAETIKLHGLRQPLTVIRSDQAYNKYEIVSGERRFRASQKAGLQKIPCIILENIEAADEIALIENIQREDLHPIEIGQAYSSLYKSGFCKTHQEIARKLGVPRSQVTEFISFAELSDEEKIIIIKNQITERKYLRDLIAVKDPTERRDFIKNIITKKHKLENKKSNNGVNLASPKKSNLITVSLEAGQIRTKNKPFSHLTAQELRLLEGQLQELLSQVHQYYL